MSDKNFLKFDLNPDILKALEKSGIFEPTPIQEACIPAILEGKDVLAIAQTGTGKTASFILPLLHMLKKNKTRAKAARMKTLIMAPTRELATQINESIKSFGRALNLRSHTMFGGVGKRPQIQEMSQGLQFLVATPGRLVELIEEGHVIFDQLEYFVLDEADRMLEMGFKEDIDKIISLLPKKKQCIFLSATMNEQSETIANNILNEPFKIEVTPKEVAAKKIKQSINMVHRTNKLFLLVQILKKENVTKAIVFTNTKQRSARVLRHLEKEGISADSIHGDKTQGARQKALKGFKSNKFSTLVATDIAGRGIDVEDISHIINYDFPQTPQGYVHRIGRTARAKKEGEAITFCENFQLNELDKLQELLGHEVEIDQTHPYHNAEPFISKEDGPKPNKQQRQRAKLEQRAKKKKAPTKKKS